MGKFFLNGTAHRISFEDGEWCDIKEEFSQADMDYIATAMLKGHIGTTNDKPSAEVSMVFGKQATLERGIIAWSFQEDNKSVPITPDNISNLRLRYRSIILSEIDRLNTEANTFPKV